MMSVRSPRYRLAGRAGSLMVLAGAMMLAAPLTMIALSALAGIVPAVKAYQTNVAENLTPVS